MVKCTSHGFLTYVFVGMFSMGLFADIFPLLYDSKNIPSTKEDFIAWLFLGLASIIGLIFVLMVLRNFAVYVENDTIVHVNWRKKKRVFHPKDLETINIGTGRQSGRQEYFFSNGKCSINCNCRNYDTVSRQILELLKDYQDNQECNE